MNVFLIILSIVVPILLGMMNIYIIVYFQDPEDKNTAWLPKIVVFLCLLISEICILMLPMDVANRGPPEGQIPMGTLWYIVYIAMTILVVVIVPFVLFYYESQESVEGRDNVAVQIAGAFKSTFFILFIFLVLFGLGWIFLGKAEVPVDRLISPILDTSDHCVSEICAKEDAGITIRISPVLFLVSLVTFFGYILLTVMGGIGLAALPFDLINDFRFRPKRISLDQYSQGQIEIAERAENLLHIGNAIQAKRRSAGRQTPKDRKNYNRWKALVYNLDNDYKKLLLAYKMQGGKILMAYLKLIAGFFCIILSLLWTIHIGLYMLVSPGISPFLNDIVEALNRTWGLLGTGAYGLFAFYLLLCVIKGTFKFGMRFFFFLPIYPMRMNGTMMNAFLFNSGLIVIGAITVTQFCTIAFAEFTRATAINQIFELSITNLVGLKYFYTFATYILLGLIPASLLFLFLKPKEKTQVPKDFF